MIYSVDQKKLRKELISIYSRYISDDKKKNIAARKDAKKKDGAWAGVFLFERDIESAIGGLVWLYINPEMSKDKAEIILENLKKNGKKGKTKP